MNRLLPGVVGDRLGNRAGEQQNGEAGTPRLQPDKLAQGNAV